MSRFDDLIAQSCPDGVVFEELGKLLDYEQPTKYLVTSTDYSDDYVTPVLTAGQTFVLGHTDEVEGIYPATADNSVIIFDDFTTAFKWVNFPFKAKSSAMKMLSVKANVPADFRYVFYAMSCIRFEPSEHARHWISVYSKLCIPFPPLVLDLFQSLEAELEAELEARRKQFDILRDQLLMFPSDGKVRWQPMGEIADLNWGDTSTTKAAYLDSKSGFLAFSASGPDGTLPHFDFDRTAVVLSAIGALAGKTWLAKGKWSCIKNTIRFFSRDEASVSTEFLYWVTSTKNYWPRRGAAQPFIAKGDADKLLVPVPPLEEQRRIVDILDKFDALVNDISIGLPAELAARRKQFEYYRDRLLTFPEKFA